VAAAIRIETTTTLPPVPPAKGPAGDGDDALVARVLAGDESAFVALHARWAPRVLRFALSRLGDRDDAEDVSQEAFLAALRGLASYQGRSSFGTWLLGITYHLICRTQRRRGRAVFVPLADAEAAPALRSLPREASLDAARALERCASTLETHASPAQREIFWLHYGHSRSSGEVASHLQRSPETVRAQLCRTRRTLLENTPGLAETLS
jgi:RNA polymerase sigma-70 factor, ECF subfamily